MRVKIEDNVKRWTVGRKAEFVQQIIQVKTTVAEASRLSDISPQEVEGCIEDVRRGIVNALRSKHWYFASNMKSNYRIFRRPKVRPNWNSVSEKLVALMEREDDR